MWMPSGITGLRPPSASRVVSRSPWSVSTSRVVSVGAPSSSSAGASTATISRLKRPSSTAARAFCCDQTPNSSTCWRVKPRLRAMRSAPSNWFGRSMLQLSGRGVPVSGVMLAPRPMRLIDSMPHAMPVSMTPASISAAIRCADCWPEPHWASMVVAPVSWGSPACSQARRAMSPDCSPACVTHPPITCSTRPGSMPLRETTARCAAPSSSAACRPESQPRRLPIGVRTASMITGLPTTSPSLSDDSPKLELVPVHGKHGSSGGPWDVPH